MAKITVKPIKNVFYVICFIILCYILYLLYQILQNQSKQSTQHRQLYISQHPPYPPYIYNNGPTWFDMWGTRFNRWRNGYANEPNYNNVVHNNNNITVPLQSRPIFTTHTAQDVPSAPNAPNVPNVPNVPNSPNAPNVPNVPNSPNAPNAPNAPNVPNAPNTSLGNTSSIPDVNENTLAPSVLNNSTIEHFTQSPLPTLSILSKPLIQSKDNGHIRK